MNKTKIEWCDYTINPVKGLCPMACPYCYARAMYKRFRWNPEIRYDPSAWLGLGSLRKPSRIFVGSTIELFGDWINEQYLKWIFELPLEFPQHTFQFLTKKPENLPKWSPFPSNCHVGVTTTGFEQYGVAGTYLPKIKARVKFISFEPLLERITDKDSQYNSDMMALDLNFAGINWVIIGQQTPVKAATTPKIEWISEIVEAADKVGVKVFLKDNLRSMLCDALAAHKIERQHFFSGNELRQEFPKC